MRIQKNIDLPLSTVLNQANLVRYSLQSPAQQLHLIQLTGFHSTDSLLNTVIVLSMPVLLQTQLECIRDFLLLQHSSQTSFFRHSTHFKERCLLLSRESSFKQTFSVLLNHLPLKRVSCYSLKRVPIQPTLFSSVPFNFN